MKTLICAVSCLTLVLLPITAMPADNLLKNSGFETETGQDDWSVTWGAFSRENWNTPPEGEQAGYIRGNYAGGNGGAIQRVPGLAEGGVYTVSAMFRTEEGATASYYCFKLEFVNDQGAVLDATVTNLAGLADGVWVQRSITATAPSGTRAGQVVFEADGITGSGSLGSDDWKLLSAEPLASMRTTRKNR